MAPAEPFKSEIEQLTSGIVALAVCFAQLHAKSDPSFPKRLESLLSEWQEVIVQNGGAPHGMELVRAVLDALADPKLFP